MSIPLPMDNHMIFYFRNNELDDLGILHKQSKSTARMAVLTGRRRVGKTSLALEFVKDKLFIYLFIAKKSEVLLCQTFVEEIERKLNIPIIGKIETFRDIFVWLMEHSKSQPLTVIVDEFQEFYNINPSVYSDVQHLWDINKNNSTMNIIFIGSIYSMMTKIFENKKEPLFGRADRILHLRPFSISEMKQILSDHGISDLNRLFEFYVLTGGIPKYLDILLTNKCYTFNKVLNFMLRENSPFLQEGRNQLIEEFGKDHSIYFSVLELIARGKTSSSEIESVIQKNVSAYLDRLENNYRVIKKIKPINAKPNSKLQKYEIIDNFLRFWFRFFHRNRDALEIGNYGFVKDIITRDFKSFSGKTLERFFFELLANTQQFNRIGSYWERGHKNEIDIVAINDIDKTIVVAEVKINPRRNSLTRLEQRATKILQQYHDYHVKYLRLSLKDADAYLT